MSLTLIYDGVPLNTTTTNSTADSTATSTTGWWDTAATGTQGAWIDAAGGIYSNSGTAGNFTGLGADPNHDLALRPQSEDALDQAIRSYLPTGLLGNNGIVCRFQRSSAESWYLGNWDRGNSNFFVYATVGGSSTSLTPTSGSNVATYNSAHTYSQYLEVEGSNPTTITVTVTDLTTSTTVSTATYTDSTSALQTAGGCAVDSWGGNPSTCTRIQTYSSSSPTPTLTVSPSTATATDGGSPVSITATLSNSSASLTASVSGGGTISTTSPTSGTAFTYSPPSTGSGTATVTVTDSTDSLSGHCTVAYAPATPTLTVSPSTASATDGGSPLSITATLTHSSASLAASVSGGGTISTTSPTSGTAFTYTPPATGSGTATVTVTDSTDSLSGTCSITYSASGPTPTLSVSPTSVVAGVPTTVTISGSNSSWTSSTKPGVSGGTNPAFVSPTISGQVITALLNPGTSAGTLQIYDTTDYQSTNITAVDQPSINLVWHGASLTYGTDSSSPGGTGTARVATVLSGLGPVAQGTNLGVAGQTLTQMIAEISTQVTPLYDSSKAFNILIAEGGSNDFYNQGSFESAMQVEASITSYITTVLAAKPWLIVWSLAPPSANSSYPANYDALRRAANTWMLSNWKSLGIAALSYGPSIDCRIGLDGCEFNATYFNSSDRTHLTDAGYTIWGEYDLAAVGAVIQSGSFSGGGTGNSTDPGVANVLEGVTYEINGTSHTGNYTGGSGATLEQIQTLLAEGVVLAANGLDQVVVETGVNARQALAPILAASAGVVSGAGTGTVTIKGGNTSTTRIVAATDDNGNRSTVTLTLPV